MHSKTVVLNSASMYFLDKNVRYSRTFFNDRIVGNEESKKKISFSLVIGSGFGYLHQVHSNILLHI